MLKTKLEKLRFVLRLNALSCIGFGVVFGLASDQVSFFLSEAPHLSTWIFYIGLGLIANGLHLIVASTRAKLEPVEVGYFILGDALWLIVSAAVLLLTSHISCSDGQLATFAVAVLVGTFGYYQWRYLAGPR